MKSQLNDLQLVITKMMTEEYDTHAKLLVEINSRRPAAEAQIIDNLSAVHKARINVLENILSIIKNMKD